MRPTAVLLGSRRASRAGARSTAALGPSVARLKRNSDHDLRRVQEAPSRGKDTGWRFELRRSLPPGPLTKTVPVRTSLLGVGLDVVYPCVHLGFGLLPVVGWTASPIHCYARDLSSHKEISRRLCSRAR